MGRPASSFSRVDLAIPGGPVAMSWRASRKSSIANFGLAGKILQVRLLAVWPLADRAVRVFRSGAVARVVLRFFCSRHWSLQSRKVVIVESLQPELFGRLEILAGRVQIRDSDHRTADRSIAPAANGGT